MGTNNCYVNTNDSLYISLIVYHYGNCANEIPFFDNECELSTLDCLWASLNYIEFTFAFYEGK